MNEFYIWIGASVFWGLVVFSFTKLARDIYQDEKELRAKKRVNKVANPERNAVHPIPESYWIDTWNKEGGTR